MFAAVVVTLADSGGAYDRPTLLQVKKVFLFKSTFSKQLVNDPYIQTSYIPLIARLRRQHLPPKESPTDTNAEHELSLISALLVCLSAAISLLWSLHLSSRLVAASPGLLFLLVSFAQLGEMSTSGSCPCKEWIR